jgi:hypothetical protein
MHGFEFSQFEAPCMEGRNIFLDAAMAGEPVVNPAEDYRELEELERIFFTPETRQKRKVGGKGKPSKSETKAKTEQKPRAAVGERSSEQSWMSSKTST